MKKRTHINSIKNKIHPVYPLRTSKSEENYLTLMSQCCRRRKENNILRKVMQENFSKFFGRQDETRKAALFV